MFYNVENNSKYLLPTSGNSAKVLVSGQSSQDKTKAITMKNIETINDWYPETKDLLDSLVAAGCQIVSGDNGEEQFKFDGDLDKFIENLTACDESHVYLKTPSGKVRWIYLVYGNNPGELASDYIVDETFDNVTEAHYNKWELRGQPKKRGYYENGRFVVTESTTLPVA